MEMYIFRHGQTEWNRQARIQGWSDIELTKEGREVAEKTAEALKDLRVDAIYASPLSRAKETACILRGSRTIPVVTDDRIKEVGFGVLEGADVVHIKGTDPGPFTAFFGAPEKYRAPEGGESLETVCERAGDFIREVSEKHKDDERIFIVAHGAVNKAMMRYIRQSDLKDFWQGGLQKNCGATIVTFSEGAYHIAEENTVFY